MPPTQRLAQHAIRTVQLYPDLKFIAQPDTSAQAEGRRRRRRRRIKESRFSPKFAEKKSDLICVGHPSHNEVYLTTAQFTSV